MPKVIREIEETHLSISRPVVLDIARQVCIQLDLPKGLRVEFAGENIAPLIHGSAISDDSDDPVRFGSEDKLKINFKEVPRENSWARIRDYSQFAPAIFVDPKLKTKLYPVYDERKVDIGFTFRFKDRARAQKTLNRIRNRVACLQKNFVHHATYHYPVPGDILSILFMIYTAREAKYGYGESLSQWCDQCFTKARTTTSNLAGKENQLAIEETQTGILGGMDEELVPEREKGSNPTYFFTGTYTFNYNAPISVIAEYPMFIHGAPLPKSIRGVRGDQIKEKAGEQGYFREHRYLVQLTDRSCPTDFTTPTNLPKWDEWNEVPLGQTKYETRLLNCAIALSDPEDDTEDPYLLLDLKTLPYALSEATLDFLKTHPLDFNQPGKTPFAIELYEWDQRLEVGSYYLTDDLCIKSKNLLDRRKSYHIAMTVMDLKVVDKKTISKLVKAPKFTNEILQFSKPGIVVPSIVPGIIDSRKMEEAIAAPSIADENNYSMWLVQDTVFTVNKE